MLPQVTCCLANRLVVQCLPRQPSLASWAPRAVTNTRVWTWPTAPPQPRAHPKAESWHRMTTLESANPVSRRAARPQRRKVQLRRAQGRKASRRQQSLARDRALQSWTQEVNHWSMQARIHRRLRAGSYARQKRSAAPMEHPKSANRTPMAALSGQHMRFARHARRRLQ
jgi:hypothetical protein